MSEQIPFGRRPSPRIHLRAAPKTISIRIPLIVDANGKWATSCTSSTEEPDWDFIEELADCENHLVSPQRHWVTVEVELPETREVSGTVEPTP